jgi:hypothetical protein
MILATDKFGINIMATGVCIKPPPPTIASTNPAKKEAIQSKTMMYVSI